MPFVLIKFRLIGNSSSFLECSVNKNVFFVVKMIIFPTITRGNLETLLVGDMWDEWEHHCREFEKHVKFVVKLVTILKVADLTQENVSCLNTSLVNFSGSWDIEFKYFEKRGM
jgi:hypothetical protein